MVFDKKCDSFLGASVNKIRFGDNADGSLAFLVKPTWFLDDILIYDVVICLDNSKNDYSRIRSIRVD